MEVILFVSRQKLSKEEKMLIASEQKVKAESMSFCALSQTPVNMLKNAIDWESVKDLKFFGDCPRKMRNNLIKTWKKYKKKRLS